MKREDQLKRLDQLKSDLEVHKNEQKRHNVQISILLEKIKKQEELLDVQPITFTDHALVRYLERIGNLDIRGVTQNLIDTYTDIIRQQKGNCAIVHNNMKLIVKDYKIITIVNK